MKKVIEKLKNAVLLLLVFTVATVVGITDVFAAEPPKTLEVGSSTNLPTYINGLNIPRKILSDGTESYCLSLSKATTQNTTVTLYGERDAGFAYIIVSEVATLALVSNGAIAVQESRIAASGIDRYMDGIYISEKVGAAKPSAKLFEHAFRDLGVTNKSRVLMVGDDLLADIKGGLNAGVDTCWFNPGNLENKSGITPKYTVSSYEELYRIVMEPEELENIGVRNRRHSNEALL